jgi:hypothetical protein
MHRLLMRAFPGYYAFNSVYAMYPFSLPQKTREVLTALGTISLYSFDLPKKPPFSIATMSSMTYITDYHALIKIFNNPETFEEMWGKSIKELTGTMYMLGGDRPENTDQHARLYKEIYGVTGASKAMWDYFENLTLDLIKRKSYDLGGGVFEMDAVREYLPLSHQLTLVLATSHLPISSQEFLDCRSRLKLLRPDLLRKPKSSRFWARYSLFSSSTPMRSGG